MKQLNKATRGRVIGLSLAGVFAVVGVVALVLTFLAPFGSKGNVPPEYDEQGNPVYVANENDQAMYSLYYQTETTLGKFVNIRGQVATEPKAAEGEQVFTLTGEPGRQGGETIVYFDNLDFAFPVGSYIQVTGYVSGLKKQWADPKVPIIQATAFATISAVDVLRPAFLEYDLPDQTLAIVDVSVTVTEIDYAYEETRLLITVSNNSATEVAIEWEQATVQVGNRVFPAQALVDETRALPITIPANSEVQGILAFPSIKAYTTDLTIPSSSLGTNFELRLPIPPGLM